MKANIVILNYEGRELLERFLPSIVRAAQKSRHACGVTVLDNCSTDGSEDFVRRNYPDVVWWPARANRVLCSYNEFAADSTDDVLIFLNNDIGLDEDFVDPILEPFVAEKDVFFVASHGDCPWVDFSWGVISARLGGPAYDARIEKPGTAFSAGIGAFDRLKFLELDGYDELYLPGRYEDVDLCYRGWKRGWVGVYQPKSRKEHVGGASFNKAFTSAKTEAMVFRNGLLFTVKNMRDPWLLFRFAAFLPLRLLAAAVRGRWHYFSGLKEAIDRLPSAWRGRRRAREQARLNDRDVLNKIQGG